MNEKLTLQDIVDLLAKKNNMTKKEADAFFREFFALITENIFEGELVKIKDFGTFKLTKINARESVDVNTGEKIEIAAHHKLSFLPDKSLKNLVNKPFGQFKTTLLEDGVTFDTIEVSEEMPDIPEDEDTAIDEIEIIVEIDELKSVAEQKTEPKPTKTIAVEKEVKVLIQPSFVYTYVDTSKGKDNETVTLVVPAETTNISPIKKATNEIDNEEPENEASLEVNRVHEALGELREAVSSLKNVQPKEVEESLPVEEEPVFVEYELTEEDIVSDEKIADQAIEEEEEEEEEEEIVTLLVLEDVTDELHRHADVESNLLDKLVSVEDEEDGEPFSVENTAKIIDDDLNEIVLEEEKEVEKEEAVEEDDDDDDLSDYFPEESSNKWLKIFAAVAIILGIVAFAGYKMGYFVDERGNFSIQLGTTPKQMDAIPTVEYESDAQNVADSVSIASSVSDEKNDPIAISKNLEIENTRKAESQLAKNQKAVVFETKKETVKRGSTLRLIAAKHYGSNVYWGYIYEENKEKIKDFDNLLVGQVLIIPDLRKYDTSLDDPQTHQKAKRLEEKILNSRRSSRY